jgi:hypothetical protein
MHPANPTGRLWSDGSNVDGISHGRILGAARNDDAKTHFEPASCRDVSVSSTPSFPPHNTHGFATKLPWYRKNKFPLKLSGVVLISQILPSLFESLPILGRSNAFYFARLYVVVVVLWRLEK